MGKSSLNFDMLRTKIFEDRSGVRAEVYVWIAHGLVGIIVGFIAFMISIVEEMSTEWRTETVQNLLDQDKGSSIKAYMFYVIYAMICVFVATMLTIYVGPGANGSGVAEIMGLLNGINYP